MIGTTISFSWRGTVPGIRRNGSAPIDFVGGGQRHSHQNFIHLAVVFAAFLILTPGPALVANECGTATGTPPTVTCDDSDKGNFQTGPADSGILYTVGHGTNGLKLTVEEGVHVSGNLTRGLKVVAKGVLTDGSKVDITSKGDYTANYQGIIVDIGAQGGNNPAVPVILNVPKGVFKLTRALADQVAAVKINSANHRSDVEINFNGQVQGADETGIGVEVYDNFTRGGSTRVTLQSEARIGGNIGYGVRIHIKDVEEWDDSEVVSLNIEAGAGIGTQAQPVKKDGVFVLINDPWKTTLHDVHLTHAGQLYATGHGIWVDHRWKDWNLGTQKGMSESARNRQIGRYDGGRREKVAVTVAAGGLVVAGDDKDGIFISTHWYTDPNNGGDFNDITPLTIGAPRTFKNDDAEDKKLIDERAADPDMYHQRVIVDGEVRGGKNGAAVHLMGGGTVTLGAKGRLVPHAEGTTSRSVEVSKPASEAQGAQNLLILLDGNFRGIQRIKSVTDRTKLFRYRILGGEKKYKDLTDGTKISLTLKAMPSGFYNDWKGQVELTADITDPVDNVFSLNFESKLAGLTAPTGQRQVAQRGKVYQALPSVLWDLSGGMERYVPAAPDASVEKDGETMQFSADGAGGGNAGWVRVEGGSGDRRLKKSLGEAVSYRLSSTGFAVGADLPGDDDTTYRAGLHHRQGRAKLTGGGQVEASGIGAGFGVSKRQAGGWVLDGWLGVTQYDDIKVQSSETIAGQATPFTVNGKTKGTSYALGVGAAMELALGNTTVTQRGSLAWTSVSMKDFKTTYMHRADVDDAGNALNAMATTVEETIAMKDGSGLQGGYGVRIDTQYGTGDCCGLFGSLDLMHDFNAKRSVSVSSDLKSDTVSTESRPTSIRLGFGGSRSWNEGRSTLSGAIYHTTAGHGNSSLSGGVALAFRF